jgi:signal transduction histidine kinase
LETVLSARIDIGARPSWMHRAPQAIGLPPRLVAYIALVCIAATAMFVASLLRLHGSDLPLLAILILLGAIAEVLHTPVGMGMRYSQFILFCLFSTLIVPPPLVIVSTTVAVVLGDAILRRPWVRIAFNVSQHTIAAGAASATWWWATAGITNASELIDKLPLVAAVVGLFYLLNSGLVSVAAALHEGESVFTVWWTTRRRVLAPQLGTCALVPLFAWAWLEDPRAIGLLMIPLGITWLSFRQVHSLEAKRELEQVLREKSDSLAARWEVLAAVSGRLEERIDPEGSLHNAARLVVEHCAEVAHIQLRDGRSAALPPARVASLGWHEPTAPIPPSAPLADCQTVVLRALGQELGVLRVGWLSGPPTPEQIALLEPLADRISLALHNAVLLEEAVEVETVRAVGRTKAEFLAAVGHEMRAPVGLLAGYGELLSSKPVTRGQADWIGDHISVAAGQLARMIDDLLDAGRFDSGRFSLNRRPVDLGAVVAAARSAAAVAHPRHRFVLAGDREPAPVTADAARLDQVLRNLLANAARHAPDDTEVTIRVERRGPATIVTVEDCGPGVPPDDRARIFEKFYRGRDAREREDGGLGLGLAIAADIVAAHGGRLWVEDAAGPRGGARFVFTLPAA